MHLTETNNADRALCQELVSSLASCSDLPSALRCLRESLRRVISIQDMILLVKVPESHHVECISKDGAFRVSEAPDTHLLSQLCTSPKLRDGSAASIIPFGGSLWTGGASSSAAIPFSAQGYSLFPLSGLSDSFVALGILFPGAVSDCEHERFLQKVASIVGASIENVIFRDRINRLQMALRGALQHVDSLRSISVSSISQRNLQDLVDGISSDVRKRFGTEILCLLRYRPESSDMLWAAMHFPNGRGPRVVGTTTSVVDTRNGGTQAIKTRQSVLADRNTLEATADENCIATLLSLKAKTYYAVPLIYGGQVIGVLSPAHVKRERFTSEEINLWDDCAAQVSLALECLVAQEHTPFAPEPEFASTTRYHQAPACGALPKVLGRSAALQRVLSQVEMVAPTDSSVLLTGETGTGKSVLAEAIHRRSHRRSMPFVVVNCSAIPATLLESEMFGHERGAFTGAVNRRIGRLEQANGGTVFFDEVGEMPLELQPKLLRAIQEQRVERLGGNCSVQLDIRFIWATNRNLEQMVQQSQFRSDLYYRISVFPILVPSLAERREDIEELAYQFLRECNQKMNKNITCIPSEVLQALRARSWPGNIRELHNVIERAAIITKGTALEFPVDLQVHGALRTPRLTELSIRGEDHSWREIERQYLLDALRETDGVIALAAHRLHMKRTTLDSRLRRVGITQQELDGLRSRTRVASVAR